MRPIFLFIPFLFSITALGLTEKMVEYKDKGQTFEGFLVHKENLKGKAPALLIVHDWLGLTDKTKNKAREFADLGYVVFAADIYGQGVRPTDQKAAGEQAGLFKNNRKLFRERLTLGLNQLKKLTEVDKKRIAAAGYCFGGTGVIELARAGADIKAAISFHGGLDSLEPKLGKNIKGKVLALHGADDPFVPASELAAFEAEMVQNKVDWQLIKFGGAVHSFTDRSAGTDNSKGAAYNEKADKRSWTIVRELLKEEL